MQSGSLSVYSTDPLLQQALGHSHTWKLLQHKEYAQMEAQLTKKAKLPHISNTSQVICFHKKDHSCLSRISYYYNEYESSFRCKLRSL